VPLDVCTRVFRGQEPRELGEGYLAAHERNTPSGRTSAAGRHVCGVRGLFLQVMGLLVRFALQFL